MHPLYHERIHKEILKIKQSQKTDLALQYYIRQQVNLFTKTRFLSKLLAEDTKYLIALKTVALQSGRIPATPITKTQLQSFAKKHKLATPNRVSAIVNVAIHKGVFSSKKSLDDRRIHNLTTTEQFNRQKIFSFLNYKHTLDIIFPELYADKIINDRAISLISEKSLEIYFASRNFYKGTPAVDTFIKHDAGYPIMMKILHDSLKCKGQQERYISLPFWQLSRLFGVSRAHVQKMFQRAHDLKLINIKI